MAEETYFIVAGVVDLVVGLSFGLWAGRRRPVIRRVTLLVSFAAAFGVISGLVVGYEAIDGKGFAAGAGWALWYSPVNLALSAGGSVFCALGMLLRRSVRRSAGRSP